MALNRNRTTVTLVLTVGVGASSVGFAVFAEVLLAHPLPLWLYGILGALSVAPVILLPNRLTVGAAVLVVGCLLACLLVPWTSRKPFLQRLHTIRPGMTESQVRQIMAGYKEGTGWPAAPGQHIGTAGTLQEVGSGASFRTTTGTNGNLALAESLVFRHSDDARFNSDWGVVGFKDGRVVRVEFLPD
jgi:hypothetical protein